MNFNETVAADIAKIYGQGQGTIDVNYVSAEGVATPLNVGWQLNDSRADMSDLQGRYIGSVTITFPFTQLSSVEKTATIQHPDYDKNWVIDRADKPSAFCHQLILTYPRNNKASLPTFNN